VRWDGRTQNAPAPDRWQSSFWISFVLPQDSFGVAISNLFLLTLVPTQTEPPLAKRLQTGVQQAPAGNLTEANKVNEVAHLKTSQVPALVSDRPCHLFVPHFSV
jgi:hypothetical protein